MSLKPESGTFTHTLTQSQIETLQQQIRQFKNLGKRFADSKIPKQSESVNSVAITAPGAPKPITKPSDTEPAAPALSWQCFNALLFYGPPKYPQEGSISFAPSDIGCFSKGAHLPLVVTRPFASTIREKTIAAISGVESSSSSTDNTSCTYNMSSSYSSSEFKLQRQLRAALAQQHQESVKSLPPSESMFALHPPVSHGGNFLSELLPWRNHYRVKKQTRRDVKVFEKDERRKKLEVDDRKKRRNNEFLKAVMSHRDDFLRFHKGKRSDCSKTARLVKMWVENFDAKKEKDEARAEMKRLQALKENDMEAYAALVQDTRNGRLKFLLNETDSYIATINKMIQDQRIEGLGGAAVVGSGSVGGSAGGEGSSSDSTNSDSKTGNGDGSINAIESELARDKKQSGTGAANKITQATKDYYRSTHRTVEVVAQPSLLKGGDLKEYQMSGLQWMVSLYNNNLNGILADEMGLGKTIQTIALLAYLMEFKHNNGPFLIVVPLSTLSNWVNEFNKWAPDILKVVYKGAPDERKRIFKDDVEAGHLNVLLTTYEYIMKDKASLRKLGWQYIIVDEGHRMKNAQSKFAQTLGTVYQSKHRILLTGTPLQNNLPELWALLNFLLPTIFSSVDTFDQWFNKPFAAFRSQGPQNNTEDNEVAVLSQEERMLIVHRLHEVLRPFMLRRVKDQVLDQLPEKVEKVLRCSLSGWQKKMYHSITMKGLTTKDGAVAGGSGLNNTIMQLRKVCNHPYLFVRDYAIDEDLIRSSGKFELLDRMLPKLKAAGHRVLMFSQMVECMNFLEQFFLFRGFKYLRLDGNTSSDDREKRMYMFNDPDSPYFIFLLSTRAGGLGLNLATADTVIIFDSDWNPMMDAQAQDRAHRIGQKNEVRVFRLITTSPIEERILSRANDKRNLTGLVVEAGKFNSKVTGDKAYNENKELMESMLKEWSEGGGAMTSEVGGDYDGGENEDDDLPDDEQINEMMASYTGEMELYTAMDAARYQKKAAQWASLHNVSSVTEAPPMPSRLMGANEKPYWLINECWPSKYAVLMNDMMSLPQVTKKKGRKKKVVPSVSNLSGSTGGMDEDSSLYAGNNSNRGSTDGPLYSMGDNSESEGEEEEEEGEDEGSIMNDSNGDYHIVAGKNMRKRKDVVYDDHLTERQFANMVERHQDQEAANAAAAAATAAANAKGKKAAALTAAEEGSGSAVCKDLIRVINDLKKIKRPDGSLLCDLFIDKPSKTIYPDYYAVIESPISLKDITNKLKKPLYKYLEEVELDFALMSANARTFNLDISPVFQDCEQLRREFFERCVHIRGRYGMPPSPYTTMPLLPSIGYQIYESSKAYRCLLSNDTVDPTYVEPTAAPVAASAPTTGTKGKRKSTAGGAAAEGVDAPPSAKKARKSSGGGAGAAGAGGGPVGGGEFNDSYYLESTIQYPGSSAVSSSQYDYNYNHNSTNSSSLSINLKRKAPSSSSGVTVKPESEQSSGSLVLSLNRKSIGNRLNTSG